jgi:hypothetical protein
VDEENSLLTANVLTKHAVVGIVVVKAVAKSVTFLKLFESMHGDPVQQQVVAQAEHVLVRQEELDAS